MRSGQSISMLHLCAKPRTGPALSSVTVLGMESRISTGLHSRPGQQTQASAALLGVGNSNAPARTLRENHSWRAGLAPDRRLGRPSFSHNRRVIVGGKEESVIDRTQTAAWKVTWKQDLGSLS